jgi:hypothetical protein
MAFNVNKNKSIIVRKLSVESEVGDLILGNISIEYFFRNNFTLSFYDHVN